MATGVVFEGKTLDDAVRKGLEALGLSRAEVTIMTLDEGSGGFLGIGARPWKVRISPRPGGPPREPGDDDRSRRSRGGERGRGGRGRDDSRGRDKQGPRGARPVAATGGREDRGGRSVGRDDRAGRGERSGRPDRGGRDSRGGKDDRGGRGGEPGRAPRPEPVEAREARPMEPREPRESREPREPREQREVREPREPRDMREPREPRDVRDTGEPEMAPRSDSPEGGPRMHDDERGDRGRRRGGRGRRGGRDREHRPVDRAPSMAGEGAHVTEDQGGATATAESPGKSAEQLAATARELAEKVMQAMGFTATVTATSDGDRADVSIQVPEHDDLLTGPKGEVRQALQHLLNLMINRGEGARYHLQLEINGFWQKREEDLQQLARDLAEQALESGTEAVTEYLNSQERRIIHVTLKEDTRVKTYALGTGLIKRVAVAPADFAGGPREEDEE